MGAKLCSDCRAQGCTDVTAPAWLRGLHATPVSLTLGFLGEIKEGFQNSYKKQRT